MSPRISYWTGWLDPQMVAVSKEVFQLWKHFPGSWVFGISPHYSLRLSRRWRTVGVNQRGYGLVRPLIPLVESRFDVSHVYTSLADWHFLRALGRRPIVLTATESGVAVSPLVNSRVAHVVAQSEQLRQDALDAGVEPERVSVIYPGVDLTQFRQRPVPPPPWKCLLASSPENDREITSKGVDLLLEVARAIPDLGVTILWRPFSSRSSEALRTVRAAATPNVTIVEGRIANIEEYYSAHHFAIAPYRSCGKPCPNSILESLACGRPALASSYTHIGNLLEREGVGVTFAPAPDEAIAAVRRIIANYSSLQEHARACAKRHFDLNAAVRSYSEIYERVLSSARSQPEMLKATA